MAGVEGCFHLGAIASVARSVAEPALTSSVNIQGTMEVFAAALEARAPVVYASSAAVYGRSGELGAPLSEATAPEPLSPYAAEKLANENSARAFGETRNLRSFGLRFFNVYGPRQNPGSPYSGVISIFMDRARAKQAITIFGDGEQTRDFIHVLDVVHFLEAAMTRASVSAPVVNVATGRAVTVRHLAEMIAQRTCVDIVFGPARRGDVRQSYAATEAATRLLGVRSAISLETGLDTL
jgi:UDP-glucose 4-epimerase